MLTIFLRSVILYAASLLAMRAMGKRQVGQLQPYEFVVALMIAELAASPMENVGTPLLYGIVPILGLLLLHGVATLLSVKFMPLRRAVSGGPSVVIRKGVIQYAEMRRMCYTTSDLLEELRAQGFLNIADVCTAVLETSGKLSVFPSSANRPATPRDLKLKTGYEGIPLTLVLDGKVERANLPLCRKEESWLQAQLHTLGFASEREVLLCYVDTDGRMTAHGYQGKPPVQVQALSASEVVW